MSAQPAVIGGRMIDGAETLDVLDPSTGELLDRTTRGTAEHVDAVIRLAR